MKQLILASASPRRAELLRQVGLDFEVIVSNAEEVLPSGPVAPETLVVDLAMGKVKQVADQVEAGIVIGADTLVVLDNQILGKPTSPSEAMQMLSDLSGKTHRVFTGVVLYEPSTGKMLADYGVTKVVFRTLNQAEILAYVNTGEPLDKAGAYGIQGRGAVLVECIDGCYFNVVGLPIGKLTEMLRVFGVSIWRGLDG